MTSVSNWRQDKQMPSDANFEAIAPKLRTSIVWLRYGTGPQEPPTATIPLPNGRSSSAALRSQRVRVWLQEFQLELTKAQADEEEIEEAMRLLRSPELYTFYVGGHREDF